MQPQSVNLKEVPHLKRQSLDTVMEQQYFLQLPKLAELRRKRAQFVVRQIDQR